MHQYSYVIRVFSDKQIRWQDRIYNFQGPSKQHQIKLCPRGAHTCSRPLFHCCDLDINPMTLKFEGDLDILKMYLHTENKVARLRHSKLLMVDEICIVNEKIQTQLSRSKVSVKCHQLPTTSGIHHETYPTKSYQFLASSFRDFVRTDTQRGRYTDAAKNDTCLQQQVTTCTLYEHLYLNKACMHKKYGLKGGSQLVQFGLRLELELGSGLGSLPGLG